MSDREVWDNAAQVWVPVPLCKTCGSEDLYTRPTGVVECRDCRRGREGMSRRLSLAERIVHYSQRDEITGCLIWVGERNDRDYGRIKVAGKTLFAHRVNYEMVIGPIPKGKQLDHLCRNPPCIEPSHLEPVTSRENTERGDAWAMLKQLTHCRNGHEWTSATTGMAYRRSKDRWERVCLVCAKARKARRRALVDAVRGDA